MPSPIAALIDLNATFGALFIGFGASALAFGVMSMQMYSYFTRYPLDVWWYKCLVGLIWLLELVDQAFIGHAVYFYVVLNWGSIAVLLEPPIWSLILQVAFGATVGAIVKICFGMRVYRFSKHNVPVTLLIMIGALAQLGAAFFFTVRAFQIKTITEVVSLKAVGTVALGLGMATDLITSASLCWFLRNLKTGYKKDDSIINQLTIYAINTGSISSAISLATLILYNTMPDNFIFMAFYFVLSKVYANSFYAALNTRRSVRGRGTENDQTTVATFLMVGQTTTFKNENPGPGGPTYSTTLRSQSNGLSPKADSPVYFNQPLSTMPPMPQSRSYDVEALAARPSQVKSWA